MKKQWKIAGLALLALGLLYLHQHHHISAEEILSWQPENLFLAAIAIECFFAIKSASVFIPIMIPQILAGHLYPRDSKRCFCFISEKNVPIFLSFMVFSELFKTPIGAEFGSKNTV